MTSSPVGLAFLKTFIFPEMFGEALAEINWQAATPELRDQVKPVAGKPYAAVYKKELLNQTLPYILARASRRLVTPIQSVWRVVFKGLAR